MLIKEEGLSNPLEIHLSSPPFCLLLIQTHNLHLLFHLCECEYSFALCTFGLILLSIPSTHPLASLPPPPPSPGDNLSLQGINAIPPPNFISIPCLRVKKVAKEQDQVRGHYFSLSGCSGGFFIFPLLSLRFPCSWICSFLGHMKFTNLAVEWKASPLLVRSVNWVKWEAGASRIPHPHPFLPLHSFIFFSPLLHWVDRGHLADLYPSHLLRQKMSKKFAFIQVPFVYFARLKFYYLYFFIDFKFLDFLL